MRIEGVPFPQAARTLAERAGVEIPECERQDDAAERQARERLERLASAMEIATTFYEQRLREAQPPDAARQELAQRNVERGVRRALSPGLRAGRAGMRSPST